MTLVQITLPNQKYKQSPQQLTCAYTNYCGKQQMVGLAAQFLHTPCNSMTPEPWIGTGIQGYDIEPTKHTLPSKLLSEKSCILDR